MENIDIDQLKNHFGNELLIGRVVSVNTHSGWGIIEAVQEANREVRKYPDGSPVNDIVFEMRSELNLERDDGLVVYDYQLAHKSGVCE